MTDEQILALVTAAAGLRRRQRDHGAEHGDAAAEERLLCLDWAVRAGRLVMADRALPSTDAMGHGVHAAQLATLGVGSLRNSRRRGLGLADQAEQASMHIAAHAAPDQFVTALLGRVDLRSGALELVNAGHMNPLLVRDGQVSEIPLDAGLVLGVAPDDAAAGARRAADRCRTRGRPRRSAPGGRAS